MESKYPIYDPKANDFAAIHAEYKRRFGVSSPAGNNFDDYDAARIALETGVPVEVWPSALKK